jgi:hypothetical protein
MRRLITLAVVVALIGLSAQQASASEGTPAPGRSSFSSGPQLSPAQRAAISSFAQATQVHESPAASPAASTVSLAATASSSRRASFYRGSVLMWTRDNVDFGFNWSTVTWSSPFQQAGWIWPNIARNRGISKYYDTARDDRFRALDTIGAGVPTPWGDVKVYSSDYVHRLQVTYNGAWSAWSD